MEKGARSEDNSLEDTEDNGLEDKMLTFCFVPDKM